MTVYFPPYEGIRWVETPTFIHPALPRVMPVNVPFPTFGRLTIVTMDEDGNVSVKVDQPKPDAGHQ